MPTSSWGINESLAFENMMDGTYSSNSADANVISFYGSGGTLMHSIKTDPNTGEVWSKTDHGDIKHYVSIQDYYTLP
ncbi:hypothetical protein C4F40_11640 [Sphingobacterium sp. Ka21]|uniref:Uncharacterized protein n=2 Tax=Sphingobacterium pedocola TaxID=2082722 RepID=A0ABR9T910_9SPHI|nr:hypothetical protein [Sphingobacterium pedocola]